jgi:hypothetical protein
MWAAGLEERISLQKCGHETNKVTGVWREIQWNRATHIFQMRYWQICIPHSPQCPFIAEKRPLLRSYFLSRWQELEIRNFRLCSFQHSLFENCQTRVENEIHENNIYPKTGHKGLEGEYNYSSTISLTSLLDGVGGQRHTPTALTSGKRPGTHCTRGWFGPRAGIDVCGNIRSHLDSILGTSSS